MSELSSFQPPSVEEAPLPPLEIIPIADAQQLIQQVKEKAGDKDTAFVERNLRVLFERVADSERNVFLVKQGNEVTFIVVAHDQSEIQAHSDYLSKVMAFQNTIEPRRFNGNCIGIHNLAAYAGMCDGVAESGNTWQSRESIYDTHGNHVLSWKYDKDTMVWTDLTAGAYIFSSNSDATDAFFNGLCVVEPNLGKDARGYDEWERIRPLEWLYQCGWAPTEFNLQTNRLRNSFAEMLRDYLKK